MNEWINDAYLVLKQESGGVKNSQLSQNTWLILPLRSGFFFDLLFRWNSTLGLYIVVTVIQVTKFFYLQSKETYFFNSAYRSQDFAYHSKDNAFCPGVYFWFITWFLNNSSKRWYFVNGYCVNIYSTFLLTIMTAIWAKRWKFQFCTWFQLTHMRLHNCHFHRVQRLMLSKGAKRRISDDITRFPQYFWLMTIAQSEDIRKDDTSILNLLKNS